MIIDNQLLDQVSGQAKESERLRMNFNLHETLDAKAQRLLNALEVRWCCHCLASKNRFIVSLPIVCCHLSIG